MTYGLSNGHVTDDVTWPFDNPYVISPKGAVKQYGRLS